MERVNKGLSNTGNQAVKLAGNWVYDKLKLPRGQLIWIEIFVVVGLVMGFLLQLGSLRRLTSNALFKCSFWVTYIAAGSLLSYVTGLIHQITFSGNLVAIWGMVLLATLGTCGNTSAFSLQDNENQQRVIFEFVLQSFWVLSVLSFSISEADLVFWLPLLLLWFLMIQKVRERELAFKHASLSSSSGVVKTTRMVAEYMRDGHVSSNEAEADPNPNSMVGYRYLVGVNAATMEWDSQSYREGLKKTDHLITTDEIWKCEGRLLSSTGVDRDGRLKDTCLSFAMFWLLLRRYAGYPLYECSRDKTWRFVRDGLLSGSRSKDNDDDFGVERAFRVIEVELHFLYDYFYTKYYAVYARGIPKKLVQLCIVILYCWLATMIVLYPYHLKRDTYRGYLYHYSDSIHSSSLDFEDVLDYRASGHSISVTWIVMLAMGILELLEIGILVTSDWCIVGFLCIYVRKQLWRKKLVEKLIEIVCRTPFVFKHWKRALDQHSLLNHAPTRKFSHLLPRILIRGREIKSVKLSKQVKKAVASSILENGPRLPNGAASLLRNGADQFSLECQMETHTHVILVWHIATSLCEIHSGQSSPTDFAIEKEPRRSDFHVATCLSKYCAYLVAFAPKLLPDHIEITSGIYDHVVKTEIKEFLEGCKSPRGFDELMALNDGEHAETILRKGAKLGKRLINEIGDEAKRWKVLADFWAELVVFLAPSDNVRAHAKYLANGGEFITHIWALLTHAGILKRDDSQAHCCDDSDVV
ncbi:hypothetical protein Ancab_033561 [Ancistrocladus abbreviatus]